MAKNSTTRRTKRLTVEVLPSAEKQLTASELKQVKGGSYEMSKSDGVKAAPKPKGLAGEVLEGTGI